MPGFKPLHSQEAISDEYHMDFSSELRHFCSADFWPLTCAFAPPPPDLLRLYKFKPRGEKQTGRSGRSGGGGRANAEVQNDAPPSSSAMNQNCNSS
ncbi:hypothetical protein GUJ93_ZPchr0013g35145 [Zizania palustris]|uniref:Uncharacterized protein n=1 Tax=Zizania palustris TaxID=103762 RepID=A0A8J5WXP8_ZIZPA|nr:hypothetical protein GUJ93_ZPchr0013g35145 [Zizania palustris]